MNPSIFLTCVEKMKSRKMKKNDTHPRWFCVFKTHPFLGMIVKTYKNNNPWKLGEKNLVKTWIQVWLVTTSPRGLNLWAFRYRHIGIPQQRDVRSSKSSSVCWLNWRSGLVGGKKIVQSSQKFHTETERFLTSWKKLSPNPPKIVKPPPTNRHYFVDILSINLLAKIPKLWVWETPCWGPNDAISIITTCIWWVVPI